MAFTLANPDRLFDRTWRPRHPLRPKLSAARRWGMRALLILLCAVIGGYSWLTDARRVRSMAASYLSDLLGGDVRIGRASLSIFEGLRLDDVTLRVEGRDQPDSTVFHAQSFLIRYNPAELLAGKLAATQIIAVEPMVTLIEDPRTHKWNYQRIFHEESNLGHHNADQNIPIPQIILRDAQVSYMEMVNGKIEPMGWYSLEGQINPTDEPGRYDFQLQSRGRQEMGPSAEGSLRTGSGTSFAKLRNFTFGPDIEAMLVAEPRQWCEDHQLEGSIDVPEMSYTPPALPGDKPTFRVQINLSGVELAVQPSEWMSREQNNNVKWFHSALDSCKDRGWLSANTVDMLERLSTPQPLHLRQVSGTLTFTEKGISMQGISGKLENNWFNLDGSIAGYSPDDAAELTLSSIPGRDLDIPPFSPSYAGSLPPQVQEIYERLHPQGSCAVWVKIVRPQAGAAPQVSGKIQITDGQFDFADFPYPITHATGTITVGFDPITKMDGIRVTNLEGRGPEGGVNSNALIAMNGFVGPLEDVAGVWIDVRGTGLQSDALIRSALPPPVDRALELFDPDGLREYPHFRGGFDCNIYRPIGPHQKWTQQIDINLDDAEGALQVFPYPLQHITGRLEVREGYVNVVGIKMARGGGSLQVDGKVTWKEKNSGPTTQPYGPDLHIVATDLPIDDALKSALPDTQRKWLTKVGAAGKLNVDGYISPTQTGNVDYTFDVNLHDGTLSPLPGPPAVSDLSGHIRVVPNEISFDDMLGRRGDGDIAGQGSIDWSDPDQAKVSLSATAENLPLDRSLYALLPASAQDGWNAIQPEGVIDASLAYDWVGGFELKIEPKKLAITPTALPYRLDDLDGTATITGNHVTLSDIKAHHGDAKIEFSGTGDLGKHPAWDFRLSGDGLPIDADLLTALPDSVSGIIKALNAQGKIGLEFSKLAYRPQSDVSADLPTTNSSSASGPDMDFAAKFTLEGDSMDIGLPATDVNGSVDLAGLVRNGDLHRMEGQVSLDSLNLAGRPASNMQATLAKSSDDPVLQISHLQGTFAGGDIEGDGQLTYPDVGPSKYDLNIVLNDADLQTLTPGDKQVKGNLTASLEMSGAWNDPDSRRGHGDVRVYGDELYSLPIFAGVLQVTDLSLPLNSPFTEATTGYSLDGQKVEFERIDLKSKSMTMSGNGELDFAKGKVNLWLVTDNPALVALPVVGTLWHGAKEELLKIHVVGTIQEPKVSASSLDTITTTVDQVLKGD
ncbi:MAG: hypothetical protein ABSG31_02880 [Tepidisphaeraceae bacterium]|jgi:hypothetical protein